MPIMRAVPHLAITPLVAALLPIALLAATPAPAAPDPATPDRAVAAIFAPYRAEPGSTAAWERPIYTRATARLIARWRKVAPADEPDALDDGDWLCQCQDWDAKAFRASILSRQATLSGVTLRLRLTLSTSETRPMRLIFRHQGPRWLIDDIFAPDMPQGLKSALRHTIAEDQRPRL